ncbi:DNA-binding GntR family transcriptional regulator [Caldalkalibacillus uzonensis]|uniref:DNA-binding GntR family transcriptional regulator n=1 Tax=Caldalkalibacillus uzonensis TaxID=353224 RepID=A0ABU0CUB5_9BACI|nr:GntR family transcriptional regulator [Caldalkalibacillus uzonensis]MDQ0338612.1 DNA-binding GntR family transcriptional regulator [Caldalkalibacillus uzonensis]
MNINANFPAHVSVRSSVYQTIKDEIMTLALLPGQKVTENTIAGRLNVSRTPVREAFLKLSQEKLIEVYPQRGSFVSLIDPEHVEEARFMRKHLEIATVKLAAESFPDEYLLQLKNNVEAQKNCVQSKAYKQLFEYDQQFHQLIFTGCNKQRIWLAIQDFMIHFNRSRLLSLASNENWGPILTQHEQIVQAIEAKDPQQAEKVMSEHLKMHVFDIQALMEKYPDYFKR